MAFSTRPHDSDGSHGGVTRKIFRSPLEFKRTKSGGSNGSKSRPAPPESTGAENFYYIKQMSAKTPMVITMTDGEQIRGWIEWYDRNCLKVNREGAPNLLVQKHCIKYVFKQEDE